MPTEEERFWAEFHSIVEQVEHKTKLFEETMARWREIPFSSEEIHKFYEFVAELNKLKEDLQELMRTRPIGKGPNSQISSGLHL